LYGQLNWGCNSDGGFKELKYKFSGEALRKWPNGDCRDRRIILIYVVLSQNFGTERKRTFEYYVQIKAVRILLRLFNHLSVSNCDAVITVPIIL
jgi:hypothetical protein